MRKWIFIATLIFVVSTVLAVSLLRNDENPAGIVQSMDVVVEEGSVRFTANDGSHSQTIAAGQQAEIDSPSSIVDLTSNDEKQEDETHMIAAKPVSASQPSPLSATETVMGSLSLSIVDAWGEAIENGKVEIGQKSAHFNDGQAKIADVPVGTHTLTVTAKGYAPAEQTLELNGHMSQTVTLEYLITLDCYVFASGSGDRNSRVAEKSGVDVVLWKGKPVLRPLSSRTTIPFSSWKGNQTIVFERNANEIYIRDANQDFIPQEIDRYNTADAKKGDRLAGISGCMMRVGDQSLRKLAPELSSAGDLNSRYLRIWDTLAVNTMGIDLFLPIELEREGKRFMTYVEVDKINEKTPGEIVMTLKTDNNGHCRFENLPAAMYYVLAQKGEEKSQIDAIYPIRGASYLQLAQSCKLRVNLKRPGVKLRGVAGVANAAVVLKSNEGGEGLSVVRSDAEGSADFPKVPFGKYTVTVTPPAGSSYETKTLALTIEEPYKIVTIEYEMETAFSVSGRVIDTNTQTPVPDFCLNLFRNKSDAESYEMLGDYAFTKTGADGNFTFENVIPGKYDIELLVKRGTYAGYVAIGGVLVPDCISLAYSSKIEVTDEDIDNVEIFVEPGVETTFAGTVLDSNGTPRAGAKLFLDNGQFGIWRSTGVSDENGKFQFSVVTAADANPYEKTVTALSIQDRIQEGHSYGMGFSGTTVKGFGDRAEGMNYFCITEDQRLMAKGETAVKCKAGDTISGIVVTLRDLEENLSLTGRIITPDGRKPEGISIHVQKGDGYSRIEEDGTYKIFGLKPGTASLQISVPTNQSSNADGIESKRHDYVDEFIEVEIPEDGSTVTRDIELTPAGFLKGRLIDAQGHAVAKANVWARGERSHGYEKSGKNGEFWIVGLRPGVEHTITIYPSNKQFSLNEADLIGKMEGLLPGLDNIIIQVKNNE
ncbi:MAG: hypothetical protein C4527_27505 [Candidatus Omnitrophota bacterium]|jgi:hypothetical protein|nr:MAG: hypothetical protein C4527_27505 [Candidatus Omnitrophota bacterium]